MSGILIVAQATGGIGKTTVIHRFAEAVRYAPVFEMASNKRLLEYDDGRAQGLLRVTHFPVRAESADAELIGSQAVRAIVGAAVTLTLSVRVRTRFAWLDTVSHIAISANRAPARTFPFCTGGFLSPPPLDRTSITHKETTP